MSLDAADTAAASHSGSAATSSRSESVASSEPSRPSQPPLQKKLVVVGDPNVGKTTLLTVFKSGVFPTVYEPTVFENSVKDIIVDSKPVELLLWDTAGQEGMDRVRVMSYNKADAVLLCFAFDSTISFENIQHKWIKEVLKHCRDSKIILVGLKTDLRGEGASPSKADAEQLAIKLELDGYIECSAKANQGVTEVFTQAVRATLAIDVGGKKKCSIM
ncbi:abnormal cell MIGration family member [Capsaspora owczarzaki ATCC 30864]|uniref:abnormal cell MIGration family member n=1 Tax=Capsaspora owczarzaki (strain ATCC 30864) TaxID=595528 RepID=UPI0003520FE7|nr:abnormal cell MIGration family member [Capsaspora owczarzaki ATCC 30864]|eukprot:XP_004347337.2 abnormal cell MIGration family member [Capsaspora owczarzaki ATCC 30864]